MSQKWSSSRFMSRQPGPSAGISSRVPTFQPPSYYAAAAGLSPRSDMTQATERAQDGSTTYQPIQGLPLSYPTADMDTDDVGEVQPSRQRKRSLSRSFSRAIPKGHKDQDPRTREDNRRQMAEIPFLETQLLPSLRDTIDKMTHPMRQAAPDDDSMQSHEKDHAMTGEDNVRTLTTSHANYASRSPVISPGYTSTVASTSRSYPHVTPVTPALGIAPSHLLHMPSPNRQEKSSSSKATSKIPSSSRGPTKPSLRLDPSVTPQVSSPLLSPRSESIPAKSLRSVKSVTSTSEAAQSPRIPHVGNMRSPAIPSPSSSKLPQSSATRSRAQTVTSRASEYHRIPSLYQSSNSPRPKDFVDSGSELEREYGRRFVAGRLVVANADVIPSSSDSEHDDPGRGRLRAGDDLSRNQIRIPRSPREMDSYKSPRIQQRSPTIPSATRSGTGRDDRHTRNVGLGFQDYSEMERGRSQAARLDENEVNVYESEDQMKVYREPMPARRSLRHTEYDARDDADARDWEEHGGVRNSIGIPDNAGPRNFSKPNESLPESTSNRRRREALVGLVNGLHLDAPVQTRQQEKAANHGGDRREYYVQDDGTPRMEPNRYDLENYDEHYVPAEDHRQSRKGKDRERQRTITQLSKLPVSSKARFRDVESVESVDRGERQDHRRSISLPPKAHASRRAGGTLRTDEPQKSGHEEHAGMSISSDVRAKKSRHRTSTGTSQSGSKRHSVVEEPLSSSGFSRPKTNRRSSSHAPEIVGSRGQRNNNSATREREAFGIPESLSYSGYDVHDPTVGEASRTRPTPRDHPDTFSQSEEDPRTLTTRSTPESERWQQDTNGFSSAAQALFSKLSEKTSRRDHNYQEFQEGSSRRQSNSQHSSTEHSRTRSGQYLSNTRDPNARRSGTISASSSAPSVYEPEAEEDHEKSHRTEHVPPTVQSTHSWRAMMPPATYQTLLSTHSQTEMERQEHICQLYHSHSDFVRQLRSIVKVFIVPLRRKHSKAWLPGVPKEISRLFDWLEDILNLHITIDDALGTAVEPWHSGRIVLNFARVLRSFIPRLEIYQPYLVRVDDVQHVLAESASSPYKEFGEFIRLRETCEECEDKTLAELLMLPVQRLYTSVDTYKRLSQLTPNMHADHLPSVSLYQSMRMMVHVMHEVKTREEEYEFVKDMSHRVEGLLPSVQLARRERRLLWHGEMVYIPPKITPTRKRDSQGPRSSILSPSSDSRSGSHRTPVIVLSPCPTSPVVDDHRRRSSKNVDKASGAQPSAVQVSVFTDALLLTEVVDINTRVSHKLFADVGISKIIAVSVEQSNGRTDLQASIILSVVPLSQSDLQTGVIPETSSAVEVHLSFLSNQDGIRSKEDQESAWSAFRRCQAYTLRSLSFPSHSGQYLPHGPQVDLELDTQKSVMDILNTGLPLPKSPSVQFKDNQRLGTKEISDTDREREERGWWTLRFQQVLREMQRQDPMLSLTMFEDE